MSFQSRAAAPILIVALAGAACTSTGTGTEEPANQSQTTTTNHDPVTANSSLSDVRELLSPCEDGPNTDGAGERPSILYIYQLTNEWWRFDSIDAVSGPTARLFDAEIAGERLDLGQRGTRHVSIHESQIESILWGAENATVYLGVKSDGASVISIVELPDGEFFFSGECADQFLRGHFDQFAEDNPQEFLKQVTSTTDDEAFADLFAPPRVN